MARAGGLAVATEEACRAEDSERATSAEAEATVGGEGAGVVPSLARSAAWMARAAWTAAAPPLTMMKRRRRRGESARRRTWRTFGVSPVRRVCVLFDCCKKIASQRGGNLTFWWRLSLSLLSLSVSLSLSLSLSRARGPSNAESE